MKNQVQLHLLLAHKHHQSFSEQKIIEHLSLKDAQEISNNGTLSGGMIPKIETCMKAIEGGVGAVHILDGRIPHVLLLEVFTDHGIGTMILGN